MGLIIAFVIGIIIIVITTTHNIETSMLSMVEDGISQITESENLRRDFNEISTRVRSTINTFDEMGDRLEPEIESISKQLQNNTLLLQKKQHPLHRHLANYSTELDSLFSKCLLLKETLQGIDKVAMSVDKNLEVIDGIILEKQLNPQAATPEEADSLIQLSIMIPGFREILFEIVTILNKDRRLHFVGSPTNNNHDQQILALLNEFRVGLQATTISWEDVIPYFNQLTKNISQLQQYTPLLFARMNDFKQAHKTLQKSHELFLTEIGNSNQRISQQSRQIQNQVANEIKSSFRRIATLSAFTFLTLAFIGFFIVRIVKPIKNLSIGIERISNGDLEHKLEIKAKDEIGLLAYSFNRMTDDLKKTTVSKEYVEDIIESMIDTMLVLSPEGIITEANRAACDLLECQRKDLIGKNIATFLEKDYKETLNEALSENAYILKSGRSIPILLTFSVMLDRNKEPKGIVCVARNITDRKEQEKEKEKLQSHLQHAVKMQAVGTLAGGIAHDFNNILAAIIGYAELTKRKLADRPKEGKFLDQILNASDRAKRLVQQILVFSRKSEASRESLRIDDVVAEALSLIRPTIPSSVPLQVSLAPIAGTVLGDSTQIHQVTLSLCTNAYHAVRDNGGEIEVRLEQVEIQPQEEASEAVLSPGPYARLTIKDTGCGMSPSTKDRVFEPFFTTKKQGEGTGLGLSVAYGIIQQHQGVITLETELGEGTTFRVFLPLVSEKPERAPRTAPDIQAGSEKILFVDDESLLADLGKAFLETLGYQVTATTSANEALEIFRKNPDDFDLVISDQTMPEISGDRLAQEMMRVRPEIPVILCTGHSETIDADRAKELGIKELLMKPINQHIMAKTIREALA